MRSIETSGEFTENRDRFIILARELPQPGTLRNDELYLKGKFCEFRDYILPDDAGAVYATSSQIEEIVKKAFDGIEVNGWELAKRNAYKKGFLQYYGMVYAVLNGEAIAEIQLWANRTDENFRKATRFRFEAHLPVANYEANTREAVSQVVPLIESFETSCLWSHSQLEGYPRVEADRIPHRRILRIQDDEAISLYRDGQRVAKNYDVFEQLNITVSKKPIIPRSDYVSGLFTPD